MKSLKGATAISGMIMFIILGATTFSQILSFSGATEGLVSAILGQGLSTFAVVALMMLILIFLGIFVDQVSMMLITLPVFMPIVAQARRRSRSGSACCFSSACSSGCCCRRTACCS